MTGKHKLVVFLLKQDKINPTIVNSEGENALDLVNKANDNAYYRNTIHPIKFKIIITDLEKANEVN